MALASLHTAVACLQQSMGADGLNYLTLGAAWWEGEWELAVNGIWSPLYGIVAAGALKLVDPPLDWVFPTVQVVNLGIFLASLVTFEWFWGRLGAAYRERATTPREPTLPEWLWWSIGYSLFLWAAVCLVEMWAVTPDMMVAATVYAAAGFLVRISAGTGRATTYAGLGAALGVGYLAKAPMFPLGIVALGLATLSHRSLGEGARRMAPALAAFLLVAGPFLVLLSVDAGQPTFSEVSRFTYLKHVNRIPYPYWRPDAVEGIGEPLHPPLLVHEAPDVYSFAGPIGGGYPASFDPGYWTEGLRPRVRFFEQANEIWNNLAFYFDLFVRRQGALVAALVLIAALSLRTSGRPAAREGDWALVLWALACFAMYSLVFVTDRYVAPFAVLFAGGLLSYWRFRPSGTTQTVSTYAGLVLVASSLTNVLAINLEAFGSFAGLRPPVESVSRSQFGDGPTAAPTTVARAVRGFGVEPGDDVALIGYGFTALWAYLAEVRIVAEIAPEDAPDFWTADEAERGVVLARFREAGASYAIAEERADDETAEAGWEPLGSTGYLIRALD